MINPITSSIPEIASTQPSAQNVPSATPKIEFGDVLADMMSNSVATLKHADTTAVKGIMGQADTREVVDAVMQAEQALQASIAIRDKIVTAYLETTRMAI